MKVATTRFGDIEFAENDVLQLPRGLFGFENERRYLFVERQDATPFLWLQSLDRADLAFVVVDPRVVLPDYRPTLSERDAAVFEETPSARLEMVVIVGIPDNQSEMTANLKGPIVFDPQTRRGRQVIVTDEAYSARFRIVPPGHATAATREDTPSGATADTDTTAVPAGQGGDHEVHG